MKVSNRLWCLVRSRAACRPVTLRMMTTPSVPAEYQSTLVIEELLAKSKVIAVVGHSDKPDRESYRIGMYLRDHFTVYPVNPAVTEIAAGIKSYGS